MNGIVSRVVVALLCLLPGCASAVDLDPEEEPTGDTGSAIIAQNGLKTYTVVHAPFFSSATYSSRLLNNSLSGQYMDSTVVSAACNDLNGTSHEAMKYIVQCALNSGSSVVLPCNPSTGATLTLGGKYGLANGWASASGTCGTSCREKISACLIALSNYKDQSQIDLNLVSPTFGVTSAYSGYPKEEAAYWGYVFSDGSQARHRKACRGVTGNQNLMGRVCGDYTDASPLCKLCNDPSSDLSSCTNKINYLTNLTSSGQVRLCSDISTLDRVDPYPSANGSSDMYWWRNDGVDDYLITVRRP